MYSQKDTIRQLKPATVSADKDQKNPSTGLSKQSLTMQEMKQMPTLLLSDAIKFLSGTIVKDYGGVGGIKTVSVRGFSAHHTGLSYDGVPVSDCQTGQLDLGKFPLQNIEKVTLHNGGIANIFIPSKLFGSAAVIEMQNKRPVFFANKPLNARVEITGGSYGLLNPSLVLENRWLKDKNTKKAKLYSSISCNYLQSKGDFPFTLSYGGNEDSTSTERRMNAAIRAITTEGNLYAVLNEQSLLHFKIYYSNSKRELPGAVIFYNPPANQTLWDENIFSQVHYHQHFANKFSYQVNAKYNYAYQRYLDLDYLNEAGQLDQFYEQQEYYLSNIFMYQPLQTLSFSVANDVIYNDMNSDIRFFVSPSRITALTTLQLKYEIQRIQAAAGLLYTYIYNNTKIGEAPDNQSHFSPSASITGKLIKNEELYLHFFYKNIYRLPSFNDLYYREVGNIYLNPENTHQLNLGLSYEDSYIQKKINFSAHADGYINYVSDKIVSIPNRNLFTWTMMNYGKVHITGIDANAHILAQVHPLVKIGMMGSYSYQRAVDMTDPKSKSYKNQIPYTPLHSGAVSIFLKTKWLDFNYSFLIAGKRYCTPQNKELNSLPSYCDQSLSISKDYPIHKILLGFKIELLNLLNAQYEIINNYPMPGRNIRITLKLGV